MKLTLFLFLIASIPSSSSTSNITLSLTNLKHHSVKATWSPSSDNQCLFNRLQYRVDVDARENTFAWLDYPIKFSTLTKHATPDIQTVITLVDNDSIIDSGFFQLKLDVVPDPSNSMSKPYNKLESMTLSKELRYNASAKDVEDGIRQIFGVKRVRVFRHAIGKFGRSDMDLNGAFSWRIEVEVSSGTVPLFQVYTETLGGLYSNDRFKRINVQRNVVSRPTEYATEFDAVIDHLQAENSYEIRVVEDDCQERNARESHIEHIKTLPLPIVLESDDGGISLPTLDQTQNVYGQIQILSSDDRKTGNMDDIDYIHGYGFGGFLNSNGHDGLVVIRSYENDRSMNPTIQTYYYTVLPQYFTFPISLHASPFIDVKIWGAGSSGYFKETDTDNVFNNGIGADFVQARLAGKPNEVFIVHVGKGGTFGVESELNKGGTSVIMSSNGEILVKAKGGCTNCESESSFVNPSAVYYEEKELPRLLPPLVVENVYYDSIKLSWNPDLLSTLMIDTIIYYDIEVSESYDNQECTEDFEIIKYGTFESKKREYHLANGLKTSSSYCFRLVAFTGDYLEKKSSEVVLVKTLEYPTNTWWAFAPRRDLDEVEIVSSPTACEFEHYPSPRRGASLAYTNGKVYLFGGRAETCVCLYVIETYSNECKKEVVWSNELWELDTFTNIWKLLSPQFAKEAPSGREQHSFTVLANGKIVIVGGRNEDTIFGDTWILDVENTVIWTRDCNNEAKDGEIICKGKGITPRYSHMAIAVNNDVYVFGGMNDGPCLDGWRYDFELKQHWTKLNTEGTARVSLQRHSASLTPYGIVTRKELSNSMSNNVAMSSSMILYDVITEEYRSLNVDEM